MQHLTVKYCNGTILNGATKTQQQTAQQQLVKCKRVEH